MINNRVHPVVEYVFRKYFPLSIPAEILNFKKVCFTGRCRYPLIVHTRFRYGSKMVHTQNVMLTTLIILETYTQRVIEWCSESCVSF